MSTLLLKKIQPTLKEVNYNWLSLKFKNVKL